jgi:hypothetical protein
MIVTIRSSSSDVSSPALGEGQDLCASIEARVCLPLGDVDIGLLADQIGVATTDTLDLGQGIHDILLA